MIRVMEFLQRRSKRFIEATGAALVLALWAVDYVTGPDFSFVVFYLIPIFLVTWFAGRSAGIAISLMSGLAWFTADVLTMGSETHATISYLNLVTKLAFFLVVNLTASSLRTSLERERELARTDFVTQVANSRFFAEIALQEIRRAGRYLHPFTVAYLDIDDFKAVNDRWGHSTGDRLLSVVAAVIKGNLRATDSVARIGGDEFVLLLPETGFDAAGVVVQKVQQSLQEAMARNEWPVTFSIGVVTFRTPPDSVDGMLKVADAFMYSVKRSGKNRIKHKEIEYRAT